MSCCKLRERLHALLLDELAELGLFTEGLIGLAAEEVAAKVGVEGGTVEEVVERVLGELCLGDYGVEREDPDTWRVSVKADACLLCPGREKPRTELCPLPGLLKASLTSALGARFYPLRWEDMRFVRVNDGRCEMRFRRSRRKDARSMEG